MPLIVDRRTVLAGMAALSLTRPSLAATTHDIKMLNVDPDDRKKRMIFLPLIQTVEPGDSVRFVASDKGHNSVSNKGMIPDGTEAWKGKINEELTLTFEKPGVYGYRCVPHAAIGMVGLIIVRGDGMTDNLEAAKAVRQRGRAKKIWEEIWATVESEGLLS